ncbi:MAG: hypothetical protein ABFD86_06910 [Bryobacteraceae bacterium]
MKREDIEKLLGAYATGTLTAGERAALYEAAVADQTLYDALMREEPLRELLADPVARARLVAVLSESPAAKHSWWLRPAPWAMAGALATVGLVAFFMIAPRPPAIAPVMRIERKSVPAPVEAPAAQKVLPGKKPVVVAQAPVRQRLQVKELPQRVGIGGMPGPVDNEAKAGFVEMERAVAPPAAAPVASVAPASLTYKVLRESGNEFVEAPAGAVLNSGDLVRLAVTAPADGRLALYSDAQKQIFAGDVHKGAQIIAPAAGGIRLGPGAGVKILRLTFEPAAASVKKGLHDALMVRQAKIKEASDSAAASGSHTVEIVLQFR